MKSHASMNRIYRLVWNAALSLWVAVAENAKGRGKGGPARGSVQWDDVQADEGGEGGEGGGGTGFRLNTACRAALVLLTSLAVISHEARAADAANASVSAGAAGISTVGTTTTVNQSTQRVAIDWTSLSTAANEALKFNQPNAAAIALNRITGSSPSELLGSLTANGQVFILNPNGVLFGAGSQVNVGGLVASTLNMSNADFMVGNHVFTNSGGTGSVVNQGTLTAANGGYIALLAPEVRNEGVIGATLGTALLAAGNKVTLNIDNGNLLGYSIDQAAINALADNRHLIKADGGQVILTASATDALLRTVVNNSGVIEAKTLNSQGGVIRLEGGDSGVVHVSGTLDASGKGAGERGGKVQVTGDKVGLFDAARVDVSGDAGGGTALIGGDFQGTNAAVKNASSTYVSADANVNADAITSGNGGKVIVWSDGTTRYNGSISAKGGAESGNGGFVEVSGKGLLAFKGEVDTSAANGRKGTLLLDPTNIWIAVDNASADAAAGYAVGDSSADAGAGAPFAASGAVDDSLLTTASLTAALANNDVVITTNNQDGAGAGNITVVDAVTYTGTNTSTLALIANNNININQSITSTNGALNVNAIAGVGAADVSLANGAAINTNGGNVKLTGRDITIGDGSAIVGGYVQLSGQQDIIFNGTGAITAAADVYLGARNIQQGGTGIAVTADKLSIRSTGYIGNSGAAVAGDDKLNTQVNTLSAVAPGAISLSNTGALTVDTVDFQGMTPPNGGAIVGVSSTGGAISLATVDTGGATDNLVLNKSVSTTGGAANTISLQANDNYTQNAGAFVTTVGANATLGAGRSLTINETGTAVSTSGANGAVDANGQAAGNISITTTGASSAAINILGSLSARGGAANNGSGNTSASSNAAFSGGSGGSVTLQTATGNNNTITVGNIDAAGGNGAASAAGVYGVGGNGGAILIRSNGASSAIQTGHLSSSGAAPGYIGDGGHAGAVTVEALGANSGVTTGNISAAGGIGSFQGQFALGASGGNGGNVTVNGKGNVTTGFIDAHGEGASANTGRNNLTTGRGGVIAVTASTGSSDVSTGALSSYSGDAFCNGNRSCTLQAAGNITVSSTGFIKVDGAVQAQGGNANGGNAPNNGAAAGNVSITSTATTSGKSVLINGRINAAGGNGSGGNGFGSGASGGAAGSVTVSSAGVGGAGSNVAIAGGINALGGAASGTGAQAVAGASKAVNVTATDGYVWQAAGNYFNGLSVAVVANRGIGAGSGALDMTGATAPDMSSRLGVAAVNSTARNGQGNAATKAGALRVTYAGGALTLSNQFQNGFVPGDFDLAVPNGDLTLSGLGRTGSANVSLSTGGNLTLTNNGLISTGSGNIRLEAAGNIGVGNQARAETTGDLYVSAGNNITQTNEYHSLVGNNLAIRAGALVGEGIGNGRLVTQVNNLSVFAGYGINLYNNTALNIGSVTFGGSTVPGGTIDGVTSAAGSIVLGSGGAMGGTGTVRASTTSVNLFAAGGINLNVDTASLTAADTGGPIDIRLAFGGAVEDVATTGTVHLTAMGGDLNLRTVSGSDVTLTSTYGAITDANGTDNNITATTLSASSQNGIALGTDVSGLQTLSTAGATADISISTARAIDTANYNISTDTGTTQNVSLTSSSASGITVGNAFASTNDSINLTATAGDINLTSAINAGGLALNAQGSISAPAAINVSGMFNLQAGTFSQVGTLPTFYAGDFRISGGTFVRALAGDGLSTGTAWQIADIYGLQGAGSADLLNKNFKLANNIDASGTVNWNGGAGFNPIASGAQFFGTLDGGGHVIDQLVINRPGDTDVGLISLMNGGTVSNLGLTGGSVTGDDNVGALVGRSIGTIINSHSSAAVNGSQRTGGLVGTNAGTISNSYASGDVSGSIYTGGLAGTNSGTVSGSYATGTVLGSNAGGLVGVNSNAISNSYASGAVGTASDHTTGGLAGINSGTITSSYANGLVQGSSETGGLVGWDNIGTVTASFWDTQTSGQAGSGGGGTGILTADMMKAQTFTDAGWNASNVGGDGTTWRIYEGHTGPLLRSFLTGLTLADTSVPYDGGTQAGATTAVVGVSGSNASARNAGSYLTGYYSNQQAYDITGGGLDIAKADLTLTTSDVTKTYDGTTSAAGSAVATAGTALLGGDTASGGAFEFTNKNFGVGNRSVTTAGVTVNDGNGGNNYNVSYVNNTTSTINKADLTVTATGVSKTYDGTLAATGTGTVGTLAGDAAGEVVNTAATQAFTDKNFGIGNKTVQASGLTIKDAGNADVTGNYNISYVDNTTSTINKADLTVTATGVTKTYDGTLAATGTGSVGTLAGDAAGEVVNTAATQAFTDKNFGIGNKTVQASGLTIKDAGNADVTGNYNIAYVDNTTSTINKADLTVTATGVTKTYDGTLAATGTGSVGTLAGDAAGEVVNTAATQAFTDKNFGIGNKTVQASGLTIKDAGNADVTGNYNISYVDNTTSTINKADLTVTATGVTKTYDGTLAATGTGSVGTLAGDAAGEVVNTAATQAFTDKNFGIGNKTVQASGLTIKDSGNADVTGNYNISYVDNTASTINKADLTVTATGVTKTYDGTLAATGTGTVGALAGVAAGELVNAGGSQAFLDKNAGTGNKAVRASGVTIKDAGNADVTGNYNIAYVDNTTSTINKADLTVTANAVTKTYDGTTDATGTGSVGTLAGAAAGESVNTAATQAFTDKNFGIGNKRVEASGLTIKDAGNADVTGNYNISYVDNTTSTINKADVTLSTSDVTKTYDGGLSASGSVVVTAGQIFTGDNATGGNFAFTDKNAGTGNKTVTTAGVTVGDGVNNANYNVSYADNTSSTINRANLVLTTSDVTKTYDGTLGAAGAAAVSSGTVFSGDSLSGGSFAFTDKNFGVGNKAVTAAGVAVNDGNGGNNYNVSYVDNTTSTINKAGLTVTATGVTKTYDGTIFATGTGSVAALAGAAAGEVVDAGGSQVFLDKNAGIGNKAVRASGVTIKDSGNADVTGNYNISYVDNTSSTINKADVTVTATGVTKTYDGTTSATGTASVSMLAGVFAGEAPDSLVSQEFLDKNAGTGNKVVRAGAMTIRDSGNADVTGNYNISYVDNTTSTIHQANLTLSTSDVTKTYDGGLSAGGAAIVTAGTLFTGDNATGGTFAFTDKNVGSGNKTVTTSGITVGDGVNNANYNITYADNTTSTINQANLTVTATGVTKTYDGTTSATGTGSIGTLAGAGAGESVNAAATQVFTDKNFGIGNKTVQAGGLTIKDSGNADVTGNYNITYVDNTTSTINKADLTVTATGVTKTYDGTLAATGTGSVGTLAGAGAGESVNAAATQVFTDKNFGIGNKTVQASGLTIKDSGNADVTGNYNIAYVDNTTSTINKANVTLSTSDVTKTYDGGLSASGAVVVTAGQVFTGDNATGGTFAFTDKNVGNGTKTVTTAGVTVGDGVNNANYNVTYTDNTTSTINQANLTLSTSNVTKTYDGTLAASGTATVSAGTLFGGDSLTGGSFAFTDKNFGVGNKTVTATGVTVGDGVNNANYNVSYVDNTTSTVNKASLTVTATGVTKTYDGTLNATGTGSVGTLAGAGAGESVNTAATQVFTDKNFGIGNKTVQASGLTIKDSGNADVTGNYNIAYVDNTSSTINKADVTVSTSDVTKTYDGTTGAAGAVVVTAGTVFAGDNTTGGSFAFTDKNFGIGNKAVTTSGVTVGDGVNNANYNITYASNTTSTINQAGLVLSTSNVTKTYDGNTTAAGSATVTGGTLFSGDSLTGGSFVFTDKNAGNGNKTVTAAGVTVGDGVNNGNYAVTYADNTTSTINPFAVSVSGTRTYDGTANVAAGVLTIGPLVAGETLGLAGSATMADKNVGANKVLTVTGLSLTDGSGLAGNYTFTGGTQQASITQASLTVGTGNVTKTYDSTTTAAGSAVVTGGTLFSGDSLSGGSFAFTDKNAGTGNKTVTTAGVTVGDGVNNGNYAVTYANNTTSTINKADLTVQASGVDKVYDGTTAATVVLSDNGFVGDVINLAGNAAFADKNAGAAKAVSVNGISTSGADAGNYNLLNTTATATASITPKALAVTANNDVKNYDGAAYSGGNGVSYNGFVAGDSAADIGGALAYGGSSQGAIAAGSYVITPGGLNSISGNYTLGFASGALSITASNASTAALGSAALVGAYDGALQAVAGVGASSGGGSGGGLGGSADAMAGALAAAAAEAGDSGEE
ncbi:YDG domain-containing protein [Polaromonas sp. YR568]|uniref:YDG domain-containing protein n=1 Tax=Polaromonas sp. YR568 TaxID=1855301 RepID=UPI00398C080A